ncbi:uncharacterized protein MYCFIDRAFT_210873 [Pseudocercospora fijiensis CIRAD86]|uniref:Uncharacterized protein n=1 Tax=Pseudocercospora fijiensis (strain CIRAD86) TaxID=383855 RepID=M3B502_PSEFD|nr:uncharacterized protein MYCFIDRAFT_210873 [Pseudocercospora fijiensis CIRAD86]EME84422.1 hypothetical protein MYCFIDRAFT_210873 [Pseudocercospora fijiensis CIRAD86]
MKMFRQAAGGGGPHTTRRDIRCITTKVQSGVSGLVNLLFSLNSNSALSAMTADSNPKNLSFPT